MVGAEWTVPIRFRASRWSQGLVGSLVAFHKDRMLHQLSVKSTAELIQYAVKHHVV
jgi:hypothetical protein